MGHTRRRTPGFGFTTEPVPIRAASASTLKREWQSSLHFWVPRSDEVPLITAATRPASRSPSRRRSQRTRTARTKPDLRQFRSDTVPVSVTASVSASVPLTAAVPTPCRSLTAAATVSVADPLQLPFPHQLHCHRCGSATAPPPVCYRLSSVFFGSDARREVLRSWAHVNFKRRFMQTPCGAVLLNSRLARTSLTGIAPAGSAWRTQSVLDTERGLQRVPHHQLAVVRPEFGRFTAIGVVRILR